MPQTITKNGATTTTRETIATLRTSVGDFTLHRAEFGWRLEIKVGKVRQALGEYETDQAAILALRNRHTGFHAWDTMGRNAAAIQIDTPQRWGRKGGGLW